MMWNRHVTWFWLTTGMIALIGFLALAGVIHSPDFIQRDLGITQRIHSESESLLDTPLQIVSDLGRAILVFIVFEVSIWLWIKRRRSDLAVLLATTLGGFAINRFLRQLLEGPRPYIENPSIIIEHIGFPSGHTMMATLTYGLLLDGAFGRIPAGYRWPALGAVGVLLLGIGFTRVYFGFHYLSDVIGGYLAGWAWLAACILAARRLRSPSGQVERSSRSQTATGQEL